MRLRSTLIRCLRLSYFRGTWKARRRREFSITDSQKSKKDTSLASLVNNSPFLWATVSILFGRYDVRYRSDDELRAGKEFQIIELNGAASEATNIYDKGNSLWSAYNTLYRQWKLVFQIGAANRSRGHRPVSPLAVIRDWMEF